MPVIPRLKVTCFVNYYPASQPQFAGPDWDKLVHKEGNSLPREEGKYLELYWHVSAHLPLVA